MAGDLAARLGELLGAEVAALRTVGTQHGCQYLTGTLPDGRAIFVKAASTAGAAGSAGAASDAPFAAEANGLRWLAEAGGPPVPGVLGVGSGLLVLDLLPPGRPSAQAAREFGAALARLHAAGAPALGAPWPGYIASLPLDNAPGTDWASWYAQRRLVPYLRMARDAGALSAADAREVDAVVAAIGELAGPAEPPSRVHGDLWSGNILWSGGRGWLIDPAAHGGHRESDLAMLALFGAPYLDEILRSYDETTPLADGWRARVPLHQLHPLLVHACLFGGAYAPQVRSAARAALSA